MTVREHREGIRRASLESRAAHAIVAWMLLGASSAIAQEEGPAEQMQNSCQNALGYVGCDNLLHGKQGTSGPASVWGALAISRSSAMYGYSYSYPSAQEADTAAVNSCNAGMKGKADCTVRSTFSNNCIGLATSDDGVYGFSGNSQDLVATDREALSQCQKFGGKSCTTVLNYWEESRREFFESGANHAQYVMETIRRCISPDFTPKIVLDFGCGVGRTLIPFAKIAERAVGADVSSAMLAEARKNCEAHQLANVELIVSDDSVSPTTDRFDLVHSFIVFQHIPVERGKLIFRSLLERVAPGGVCAIHVLYSKVQYADTFGIAPPTAPPATAAPQRPQSVQPASPEMQMNPYPMNALCFMMQQSGVRRLYSEFTDHGGELGQFIFFQLP